MSDWRDRVARVEDRLDKIEADIKEIKKNAIFALSEPDYPQAITATEEEDNGEDKGIEIKSVECPDASDD